LISSLKTDAFDFGFWILDWGFSRFWIVPIWDMGFGIFSISDFGFGIADFNPPTADEGLIPRPLGRLKFSV